MIRSAIIHTKDHIKENLYTTLTGVAITGFSLIILGTFILIYLNLIQLTTSAFQKSNYSIFLKEKTPNSAKKKIVATVRKIKGIGQVRMISSEDAKIELVESFGDAKEMIKNLDFPKFPEIIEFALNRSGPLTQQEQDKISSLSGAKEIVSGRETQEQIEIFFTISNFVGVFLIFLLIFSVILVINSSIQIAIRIRIKEIEILKILGASSMFIRLPYILEGILIAITSYIVALGCVFFLTEFVLAGITFNETTYAIRDVVRFFTPMEIVVALVLLIISGAYSSVTATKKVLNQIKL